MDFPEDDYDNRDEPASKPFWICQECGHIDKKKTMPEDRAKFYERMAEKGSPKCPKCKSEAFVPQGF